MRIQNKFALSTVAGLSLLGTLAGCSSTTTAATTDDSSASSSDSGSSSSSSSTGTYKDGSYTEEGSYQSPAGNDSIKVEVTLKSNVVTAVTVTGEATNPTAKEYQSDFISGIQSVVVGKKIDDLNVSKVAGSSLTSTGFNAAIEKIKSDAS
ncbi:hypothetical protein BH09ACT1_BH09ACT1_28160 [soil metagenome]|jgi:uncharacterized protein with FMN-binding domain